MGFITKIKQINEKIEKTMLENKQKQLERLRERKEKIKKQTEIDALIKKEQDEINKLRQDKWF